MVKSAVKVMVRTRPTSNFASKNINIVPDTANIDVHIPKDASQGMINNQQDSWKFKFDGILHNASQDAVYDKAAREIVSSVVEGYNGSILAYGQTGAGKTFTMTGPGQVYKYRGMMSRAISHIFQEISAKIEQEVTVKCGYVEIYNELMYDLLSQVPSIEQTGNIMIQDDALGGIHIKGLSFTTCRNEEEALNCLFEGDSNKTVAEHSLNKQSSRSHCVFIVQLESRSRVESSEKVICSKLNIIDLAGSERTKKTGSEGITLTEANFINKSLSYLEQVVVALSDRGRDYVPYRQSKLTHMLKDSLGGNSKTLMMANIWPEPDHIEETISTLRFATRMMRVSNEATINVKLDPAQLIKRYEREVRDLKQELAMHDTLANRGRITYEPYTPEQQYEMQKLAEGFLDGSVDDIEISSLRQVKELFYQFRGIYRKTLARLGVTDLKLGSVAQSEDSRHPTYHERVTAEDVEEEGEVGDVEQSHGFGVGKADAKARPLDSSALEPRHRFEQEEEPEVSEEGEKSYREVVQPRKQLPSNFDKNQAFMEYKNTIGKEKEDMIESDKNLVKQKKTEVRSMTLGINSIKREIDDTARKIDEKKLNKQVDEDIIDEEEFALIKDLKELKRGYREKYEILNSIKSDINMISQNLEQTRTTMLAEFEDWIMQKYGEIPGNVANMDSNQEASRPAAAELADEEEDLDAIAYIKAKRNVSNLHKAKKQLLTIKHK